MLYYPISGFINAITSLVLALMAIHHNPRARLNRVFAYFSLSVSFWSWCYFFWQISNNYTTALFWSRALMLGAIFVAPTIFHLSVILTGQNDKYRDKIRVWYGIFSIFALLDFTSFFVKDVRPRLFFPYWPSPGIIYTPFLILWGYLSYYSLILMFKVHKKLSPMQCNQVKYVLLGAAIGILAGSTNYFLWYDIPIPPVGNILVSVYVVMVFYAIVKYRLMDIRIFALRGLVFGIVYAAVLGIPLGLVKWGRLWLKTILGEEWFWLPVFILFGLATMGPFIYNYIRRRAEDAILKEERRYQGILRKFSLTMTLVKNLDQLLKLIVYRVNKTVKVKLSSIYLADNLQSRFSQKFIYAGTGFSPEIAKEIPYNSMLVTYLKTRHKPVLLEELSAEIKDEINLNTGFIVPCFVHQQLLGFLILGQKLSGKVWSEGDIGVFEVLANQASLAIENTIFLEELQKNQAQLFVRERMASLGTMAGGMTHQINNRFHAISMATDDALDTLKLTDAEKSSKEEVKNNLELIRHALEAIVRNTACGGKIVNDFLDFSQPDARQKETKEFEVTEPLERAIEMLKIKSAVPDEIFIREIQPNLTQIHGDLVLLQDSFFNLLNNGIDAIKLKEKAKKNGQPPFSAEGYKGRIVIRVYQIESHIVIQFSDNGMGMTEQTQRKIFVPFFTTKATSIKGTGLGLFVIEKIINSHAGEITMESRYGEGTTFTIRLPLCPDKKEEN